MLIVKTRCLLFCGAAVRTASWRPLESEPLESEPEEEEPEEEDGGDGGGGGGGGGAAARESVSVEAPTRVLEERESADSSSLGSNDRQ